MKEGLSKTDALSKLGLFVPVLAKPGNSIYDFIENAKLFTFDKWIGAHNKNFSLYAFGNEGSYSNLSLKFDPGLSDENNWKLEMMLWSPFKKSLLISYHGLIPDIKSEFLLILGQRESGAGIEIKTLAVHTSEGTPNLLITSILDLNETLLRILFTPESIQENKQWLDDLQIGDRIIFSEIESGEDRIAFKYSGIPNEGNTGSIIMPTTIEVRYGNNY